MSNTPLIEAQGIAKTFRSGVLYRPKRALTGLDLRVASGEIFGFLGPNGAGKTTTIKILLGLVRPSAGSGTVLGEPFGSVAARAQLGYLPDLPHFYSYLTGRELLRFAGRLHSIARGELERRIEATLARVHLAPDAWDRRLRHYSRGMFQRVGIAAAILHRPRLLVLDEPMTGLDPIGRRELRDLLLELKRDGTTIFLSSHLLADVESTADFAMIGCYGGYTTNLPVAELLGGKAWVVHTFDGAPLHPVHGGPARLLVPHLYFWKSAKWVNSITLMPMDRQGFWERLGYHDLGDPWREQRYQGD